MSPQVQFKSAALTVVIIGRLGVFNYQERAYLSVTNRSLREMIMVRYSPEVLLTKRNVN